VVNGIITAIFNVNSFITTLGTLFTLSGLTLIISHSEQLTIPGAPTTNPTTGASHIGAFASVFGAGTYSELIWAVVIVIVLQLGFDPNPVGSAHDRRRLQQARRGGGRGQGPPRIDP